MTVLALIIIFALGLLHIIPGDFFVGLCILWSLGVSMEVSARVNKAKHPEIIVPPVGLGGCVLDSEVERKRIIPSGLGSDVPVAGEGQRNDALIRLIKSIETEIEARISKEESAIKNSGTMIGNTIVFGDHSDTFPMHIRYPYGHTITIGEDVPGAKLSRPRASSYFAQENRKTLALMKDIDGELEDRAADRGKPRWGYTTREVVDALTTITTAQKTMAVREESVKTDEIYEEPVASYPMEMRI